ncbi:MAG: hypothetical protein QOG31_1915 [Thermoplasmata archaeon]|jgi:hypothetical protein|nr:hypothetical protein [Thermoplasmata archaeon]
MGPGYTNIEVGRCAPLIRNGEDAEALARCSFLDPTVPIEFNVLAVNKIRRALDRTDLQSAVRRDFVPSTSILGQRPAIGYVPPEVFLYGDDGLAELGQVGDGGAMLTKHFQGGQSLRGWAAARQDGSLGRFLSQVVNATRGLGGSLLAPPTIPVTPDIALSPVEQMRFNVASINALINGPAGEPGNNDSLGLLYPVHVTPSALEHPELIRATLDQARRGLDVLRGKVWGVHIHLVDVGMVTKAHERVKMTGEFMQQMDDLTTGQGIFPWASDFGPAGPALLDVGASFASYHTGSTMKRIYSGGAPGDQDLQCGKALGLWDYNMFSRKQVRARGDKLDETGLFPHEVVPAALRSPKAYRVEWGRPRNVSVLERINQLRDAEITQGHARPGRTFIARSTDRDIMAWTGA